MQVEALVIPPAPPRVRLFAQSDLHVTLGFLGPVRDSAALAAWQSIDRFPSLLFLLFRPLSCLDLLRRHARRAEAIGGVAGRGVHDEEHDHRDADEDGDRLDDPAEQVLRHLGHYLAGHTGDRGFGHVDPV